MADVGVEDAENSAVPIRVGGGSVFVFMREDHEIRVSSGVECILVPKGVVCRIVYAEKLVGV